MDLVDEQHVPRLQVGQNGREVPGPLDHRARRGTEPHPQLAADDLRQGGLAQPRRPMQQHVIQRLGSGTGGLDKHRQVLAGGFLPHELRQGLRAGGCDRRHRPPAGRPKHPARLRGGRPRRGRGHGWQHQVWRGGGSSGRELTQAGPDNGVERRLGSQPLQRAADCRLRFLAPVTEVDQCAEGIPFQSGRPRHGHRHPRRPRHGTRLVPQLGQQPGRQPSTNPLRPGQAGAVSCGDCPHQVLRRTGRTGSPAPPSHPPPAPWSAGGTSHAPPLP